MGDNNESIGGIAVEVVGDYSKLQADLEGAQQIAAQAGAEVAAAFNQAADGVDTFESRIEALVASGSTLAEALTQVQSGAVEVGAAATQAAEQLSLFDEAIQVPYADAAGQLNLFATELEPIAPAAQQAASALDDAAAAELNAATNAALAATAESELAESTGEVGHSAHEASSAVGELGEKFIAFGEALAVTEGLHEFGREALAAADNITRADIALTAITKSAEQAESVIKGLEALGVQDGLAMPSLLTAATRMQQLLGPGADVVSLLGRIADGAVVMHTDIGAAADMFDRMAANGVVMARSLGSVGLTMQSLADAVNKVNPDLDATATNLTKIFKTMDQSERIDALKLAFEGLAGTAQKTADATFGGQWQILANQWEQIMKQVGDALLPVISGLTDLMKTDILPFLKEVVDGFRALPTPVQDTVVGIGLMAAAIVPLTLAVGGLGIALEAAGAALAPLIGLFGGAAAVVGGGLLTALAAAAFGFTDLKNSMAETNKQYAAMDQAFQKYITGLATGASTQDQVKTAQEKINLALSEGLISATQASQGLALLDATEKKLIGNDLSGYFQQMGIHLKVVSEAMTPAAAATAGLQARMESLKDAVAATQEQMIKASAAYKDGTGSADDAAKAYGAWQAATGALRSAQEALLPVVLNVHHATHDFVDIVNTIPTAEKAAADAQDALNIKWTEQNAALTQAQGYLDQVLDRYRAGHATMLEVAKALDTVNQTQAALNQTTAQFKLPEAFATWPAILQQTQAELTALQQPLSVIPQYVRTAADALHDMGIKTDDAGHALQALLAGYEELGTKTHTLDDENVAWEKIGSSISKLSKTDMPEVLRLYDEHLAQLQQLGASEGLILQTQGKELQAIIDIKTQSGESATQQIVDLNRVRLQQQALYDQTHLLGDLYVGIQNDILKGWESMGKAIADNIVDGNNWGQTFLNVGKQVAKMILEEIVGSAFKALKDALFGASTQVTSLSDQFTKLAKTITDAFSGSSIAGKAGDAAASNASGGLGSLGVVGAIANIGTLISSIIGNFQMAHLSNVMGQVEHNTRYLQIEAEQFFQVDEWQRHDEILAHFDSIYQRLGDIWESIYVGSTAIVAAINGVPGSWSGKSPGTTDGSGLSAAVASGVSPGGYGAMASPSSATYNNASTTNQSGPQTLSVTINEAGNARNTARELSGVLKIMTPSFATFTK